MPNPSTPCGQPPWKGPFKGGILLVMIARWNFFSKLEIRKEIILER
jgi:hypothetical protein